MSMSVSEALKSARETRALLLGSGVVAGVGRVFREQFPGLRAVVVADRTTIAVAGALVRESLAAAGVSCVEPFIFEDANLYAEMGFVERLENSLRGH